MTGTPNIPDEEASFENLSMPPSSRGEPHAALPADEAAASDGAPSGPSPDGSGKKPSRFKAPRFRSTKQKRKESLPEPEESNPKKKFKRSETAPRRRTVTTSGGTAPRRLIEEWLSVMVKSEASDLILRAGGRPSLRIGGKIEFLPGRVPGPGPMLEVFRAILGERRLKDWTSTGSADSAIQLDGLGRFRINAYKQMAEPAMVIRRIGEQAPNLDDLHLPAQELKDLAMRKRGLILVTGIAGSGKSTTLAGMIQYMNENVERHIVTLEDPVELVFTEKNCVISQREVGTDTTSFSDGLRHALRQSPDVILIGEVRDATTVVAALEATETGHMVMSTMHTVNAAQTVDRMLGFFPAERHAQVRQRLADNLAGVLSQRLVSRKKGGLMPAYELMVSTPHVKELINDGQTSEMARVIEGGSEPGLISFNECLRDLVERQEVELNDALATSDRPDELLLALRGIRGSADRVAGPEATQRPRPHASPEAPAANPDGLRLRGTGRATQ